MMIQPTPEQWGLLTPMERLNYRLGDLFSRRLPWVGTLVTHGFGRWFVWFFCWRRFRITGQEHLDRLRRTDRVLMIANHRSFFDFYVVICVTWLMTKAPRRLVMPVRSTFFYDTPLGPLLNLIMSGYSMFPPILRDRKRGVVFNRFSQDRMVDELGRAGTLVGMHPEGMRNLGPDPYTFLPPKPGTGRLIRKAVPGTIVMPVFIFGMSNSAWTEFVRNYFQPKRWPIDLVFGTPLDLSDLVGLPDKTETHLKIVERCMTELKALAEVQRALRPAQG